MQDKPQIIYENDRPAFVILPWADYKNKTYLHSEETISDKELAALSDAEGEEYFPADVVNQLLDGKNAIKVYRKHRGLTQKELAEQVGINTLYLSQIETGKRIGSVETLKSLAEALSIDLDDLV